MLLALLDHCNNHQNTVAVNTVCVWLMVWVLALTEFNIFQMNVWHSESAQPSPSVLIILQSINCVGD